MHFSVFLWHFNPARRIRNAAITGKSFSEALILESVNPKYDERLFIEFIEKTSSQHIVYRYSFECQNKNKKTIFVQNAL